MRSQMKNQIWIEELCETLRSFDFAAAKRVMITSEVCRLLQTDSFKSGSLSSRKRCTSFPVHLREGLINSADKDLEMGPKSNCWITWDGLSNYLLDSLLLPFLTLSSFFSYFTKYSNCYFCLSSNYYTKI